MSAPGKLIQAARGQPAPLLSGLAPRNRPASDVSASSCVPAPRQQCKAAVSPQLRAPIMRAVSAGLRDRQCSPADNSKNALTGVEHEPVPAAPSRRLRGQNPHCSVAQRQPLQRNPCSAPPRCPAPARPYSAPPRSSPQTLPCAASAPRSRCPEQPLCPAKPLPRGPACVEPACSNLWGQWLVQLCLNSLRKPNSRLNLLGKFATAGATSW